MIPFRCFRPSHEAKRNAKPNAFNRFQMSFMRVSLSGTMPAHRVQEVVIARTEDEVRRKLQALRGANTLLDDVCIDGVFDQ